MSEFGQSLYDENVELRGKIDRLRAENSDLKEGLRRYANGYQGSCYACEPVGEMNVALRAENERLRGALSSLANEAAGLEAFEGQLGATIGITNYACIMRRVAEARAALGNVREG